MIEERVTASEQKSIRFVLCLQANTVFLGAFESTGISVLAGSHRTAITGCDEKESYPIFKRAGLIETTYLYSPPTTRLTHTGDV